MKSSAVLAALLLLLIPHSEAISWLEAKTDLAYKPLVDKASDVLCPQASAHPWVLKTSRASFFPAPDQRNRVLRGQLAQSVRLGRLPGPAQPSHWWRCALRAAVCNSDL